MEGTGLPRAGAGVAAGAGAAGSLAADLALAEADAMGFDLAGVATDGRSEHMDHLRRWVAAGMHGGMSYLARPDATARRADLARSLEGFRSAVVVARSYAGWRPGAEARRPGEAVVARYARGLDYHDVLLRQLGELGDRLARIAGTPFRRRAYVDTGPVLERELARRAGLGWFGKNTMLIHPRKGSYFFLGALLTDLPLAASVPFADDHCGTCRRCLDACPTGALLGRDESGAPVMDATRCISYLTIELKGPVPRDLRTAIGNRVFGCDICQEVCPWNAKFSAPRSDVAYAPRPGFDGEPLVRLAERLLGMSGKRFRREFAGSAATRPGRNGLLRNVCIGLGNWGSEQAVPALRRALEDAAPLVRGHAAWALGRIGTAEAVRALEERAARETDADVLEELAGAGAGGRGADWNPAGAARCSRRKGAGRARPREPTSQDPN